jgi:hypothetical protein
MAVATTRSTWRRAAAPLGLAALTALWAWLVFTAGPLPAVMARLGGVAAVDSAAMRGGAQMRYRLPPGADPRATVGALNHRPGVRARAQGGMLEVEIGGVAASAVQQTVAALTSPLGIHVVRSDHAFMRELCARVTTDPLAASEGVTCDRDLWSEESGRRRHDDYLQAPTLDALQAYLRAAGVIAPPGLALMFEQVDRHVDQRPFARTYLVDAAPAVDGARIADAAVVADPYTYRPQVLATFDPEGAIQFGDLTAASVGDKLVTALGDRVVSAPVVHGAIRGGQAMVSMGGGDAASAGRDAEQLAAVLRVGPLPRGGTIEEVTWIAPAHAAVRRLRLVRGALALALGVLAAVMVLVVRRLGLRRTEVADEAGPRTAAPIGRLLVTLLPLLVLWLGGKVLLPGIDRGELQHVLAVGGGDPEAWPTTLTIFALGLTPLLTAALLVEAVVFLVPPWRRRRHAGPDGRRRIGVAVAVTGAVLAALQAYLLMRWAEALAQGPLPAARVALLIATAVTGVLVLALVAELVSAHGLANGYTTLALAGVVLALGRGGVPTPTIGVGAAMAAAALTAVSVAGLLRARVAGAAVPNAGLEPLSWAPAALVIVPLLAVLEVSVPASLAVLVQPSGHVLGVVVVTIGLAAALSWRAPTVDRPDEVGRFVRATVVTTLALVALYVLGATTATVPGAGGLEALLAVPTVALATAYAMDVAGDWRARRRGLTVACWPLHRTCAADDVAAALAGAGIAAHLRSRHQRQLTQALAPWLPIEVMVAPSNVARARELVATASR